MNKRFCGATVKGIDNEERTLVGLASNDTLDRDREKIVRGAWKDGLESYRRTPVIMLSHIYSGVEGLPIGVSQWIKEGSEGLVFKMRWATKGINPVADVVSGLYADGVMNAFSVGFLPLEYQDHPENSTKLYEPIRTYTKCQLLEISAVAIPSNSEAVVQSAIKAYQAKKWPIKPGRTIVPRSILDRSLYDDDMIEIDNRDVEMMVRSFGKVPGMVMREMDQYLAEYGSILAKQVAEHTSIALRKAMGRAY